MSFIKRALLLSCLLALLVSVNVFAFVVHRIRIVGAQRVSRATILNYVPIRVGQNLTPAGTTHVIQSLYKTGFFSDVSLARQGGTLIIRVDERPIIGSIKFSGNKSIKSKQLRQVLKEAGITEGQVFNRSSLVGVKQALEQEYYNLGRYNAKIHISVTKEARNRVSIDIKISEGVIATIKQIKIIGNEAFSEKKLLKQFTLTTPRLWTFITHTDRYSRQKLDADLQHLTNYYQDRGYLRFQINSVVVSITPDRRHIYITIKITEGHIYRVSGFKLAGNFVGQKDKLRKLIDLKPGEVFSRKKVVEINQRVTTYLADQGFAFANVRAIPKIDDAKREVYLTFYVNPGHRVYVRRIIFSGNSTTADDVLRREVRQSEGGLYSLSAIYESKRRLANLGYLQDIKYKVVPVPGHPNQVDLHFHVKETHSATASAQIGYSGLYGFMYGANITQRNLRGTGKAVSLAFNRSSYVDTYNFTYVNPYYTQSGISRSINVYYQRVTPGRVNLSTYSTDALGVLVNYSIPISEYDYLSLGFGYENTKINADQFAATEIQNFLRRHGRRFDQFKVLAGWTHSNFDRAILPTKGFYQWLGVEAGVPITNRSLEYYKVGYAASYYHPVAKGFIFHARGQLGYGDGYGKFSDGLPFFKNYYAGGIGSVRGYEANTLGPKDSRGDPIGGNVLVVGSASLILPQFINQHVRTSIFFDAGNVYENRLNFGQLRYAVGIGVEWIVPLLGPLQFSLAKALNVRRGDRTQVFDFTIGTSV